MSSLIPQQCVQTVGRRVMVAIGDSRDFEHLGTIIRQDVEEFNSTIIELDMGVVLLNEECSFVML